MSDRSQSSPNASSSRRTFLKHSSAAMVGGALAASLQPARTAHAAGSDVLKVGLIGCGGRGTGAALNASHADDHMQLVAMADVFEDRLEHGKNILSRRLGDKFAVTPEQSFHGFDAYKQLIDSDVDVVLLATPPHFRPEQLKAAIDAGKHVFCEKPVAVDGPGVRSVLETSRKAKEKNLSIVSGLCWRYDYGVRETIDRIKNGMIGDVVAVQENYLTGTLWHRGQEPDWSDMEYQLRNWLYYTWLSGDHIVEQHIHSLDKALWLMDDRPPARAVGLGGRQVRTDEKWGHIYDHFAVCFEWETGEKTFSYTRQMAGCSNDVEDYVLGSKGRARVLRHEITPKDGEGWKYDGPKPSMYDVEHKELFAGIRSGNIINNGEYMSYSTLMAIMGRDACYTGQVIDWDAALNSEERLGPEKYVWGPLPSPPVPQPGSRKS